jgi:hypothetical protein
MAGLDRFEATEHTDARPQRTANVSWLAEASTLFAIAVAGMVVVFLGLAVDGWRHNNGASEESIISLSNPGHLIAAIGLLITTGAALAGLSMTMLRGVHSVDHAIRRMVPVTAAWVLVAAAGIGSIVYLGASGATIGHDHVDGANVVGSASDDHDHAATGGDTSGGDAGVAAALREEGVIGEDGSATGSPGGIGSSNTDGREAVGIGVGDPGNEHGTHDHGKHATFAQLNEMSDAELISYFPEGTLAQSDLPELREQLAQVREIAEKYPTTEAAEAAGYRNTTSDVPAMGMHYLNTPYVMDGEFDPAKPEGLLFAKVDDGEPKLVGVWFLLIPGVGGVTRDVMPSGFTGDLDLWHAHIGLCLVGTDDASEGESRESCEEKGGRFTADLRWMMHVWVAPEFDNPDGFFAYLNYDLAEQQAAAQATSAERSGITQ